MKLKLFSLSLLAAVSVSYALTAATTPAPPTSKAGVGTVDAPTTTTPASTTGTSSSADMLSHINNAAIYASPGIVTLQGGEWVGSDHLYNLPTSIGVVIELIKPIGQVVDVNEGMLKEKIKTALATVRMTSRDPVISGGSALPFFHLLVIIHPIDKGFIAYCTGRLFEEVTVGRIHLKSGITWQAITWEKQELIVAPPEQLQTQLLQTVDTLIGSFTDRIKSYALEKPSN